jgi:hypothetical protein
MEEIYGDEWENYDKLINKKKKKGVALSQNEEERGISPEIPF